MAEDIQTNPIPISPNPPKEINPLDSAQAGTVPETSSIVENIVATETGEKDARILELAPTIDTTLLKGLKPPKSVLLEFLKIFFAVLLFLSFASVIFFTSQMGNTFSFIESVYKYPNITRDISIQNTEVLTLQTDLNLLKLFKANSYLNQLSYYTDSYINNFQNANSMTTEESARITANESLAGIRNLLRESFMGARENLKENWSASILDLNLTDETVRENYYQTELENKLTQKASELATNKEKEAVKEYNNYLQAKLLIRNAEVKNLLMGTDFDALSDKDLYVFLKNINGKVINNMSTIQKIKDLRIRWSDVMNEIDLRTMKADKNYQNNTYDLTGGIRYTSYDFDKFGKKISIVGEIKKFDTKNFTLISDLLDNLNSSDFFGGAEMKSFSKSGSIEEGYTSSIKITLDLKDDIYLKFSEISLGENAEAKIEDILTTN